MHVAERAADRDLRFDPAAPVEARAPSGTEREDRTREQVGVREHDLEGSE